MPFDSRNVIKQLIDVFIFDSIPDQYKTQIMCGRIVSVNSFLIVYCPDKYKTQKMFDKVFDDLLAALKPFPDWFVLSKMIKEFYTALYADENILYFNDDSGNFIFSCNKMSILNIDINNINLDNNFNEDDPDTIVLIRLLAWHIKFEKHKAI